MTATCRFTLARLGDLADDALPAPELSAIDAHLAMCPACTRFLAGYRGLARVARVATDVAAPEDAVRRALDATRRRD